MATEGRKAKLLRRKAQIEAQLADMNAREFVRRRRAETRGKIITGANALNVAKRKPSFRDDLTEEMNRTVTRPEDRALFDFLPETPAPAASEGFAGAADPGKPKDD